MHIVKRIQAILTVIDLNSILYYRRSFGPKLQGATDEHSAYRLRPDHGLLAASRVPKMRSPLPRGLQDQEFFLSRSVPLSGLRPADLPGKPSRYRGLPANHEEPALPHGYPRPRLPRQPEVYPINWTIGGPAEGAFRPAVRDHCNRFDVQKPFFQDRPKNGFTRSPRSDDLKPVLIIPRPPKPAAAPTAFRNKLPAASGSPAPHAAVPRCRIENRRRAEPAPPEPSGSRRDKPLRT